MSIERLHTLVLREYQRKVRDTTPANERLRPDGLTIAIPNWNHELALSRALRSAMDTARLLRTDGVVVEVLVVDDESHDGSLLLLRQYEALYYGDGLRVHALRHNVGLGAARNVALNLAAYRYIVFLDADNELVPANMPQFYATIRITGAAVVYGNLVDVLPDGTVDRMISNDGVDVSMFSLNYVDACALFDAHQLLDVNGYVTGWHPYEDWELNLHLATNGRRAVFVPLLFGIYNRLPGSMTAETEGKRGPLEGLLHRMYDQLGLRKRMAMHTRRLRYHPDVGYW